LRQRPEQREKKRRCHKQRSKEQRLSPFVHVIDPAERRMPSADRQKEKRRFAPSICDGSR
jgi:hypothetical protein